MNTTKCTVCSALLILVFSTAVFPKNGTISTTKTGTISTTRTGTISTTGIIPTTRSGVIPTTRATTSTRSFTLIDRFGIMEILITVLSPW